jgi:hypothetical protein
MDQTGAVRKFTVPSPSSGGTQSVELRTEWKEGNSTQQRTRIISVRAGQQVYTNLAIADRENLPAPSKAE